MPALGLLCLQFYGSLGVLVKAHGASNLAGHAALLSTLQVVCVLMMALPGSQTSDSRANEDVEWLSTLPAPPWVLHAAKLAEAAVFNPVGWILLFPFFTALGIHTGFGVLAPLIALGFTLPLLLCCALLGSVIASAQLTLRRSRGVRFLGFLGSLLGTLAVVFWVQVPLLSRLDVNVWRWLDTAPKLAWLPFGEPALALCAWKSAPLASLGWFGLFVAEMMILLGLGTLVLSKLYRAELVLGRHSRRGARGVAPASAGASRRRLSAGLLGAVASSEMLWLLRNPAQGARFMINLVLVNGAAILLAPHASGLNPVALPGYAWFGVGTVLLIGLHFLLERERPALFQWAALPRPMSRLLASKTLLLTALAMLGALPTVLYAASSLPRPLQALPALLYAGAGLVIIAFLQTALWFNKASPQAPTGTLGHLWRGVLLLVFAYWLGKMGLLPFGAQLTLAALPPLVTGAALAWACWTASLSRAPFVLDSSAPEPKVLTVAYALVTLLILRDQQAGGWAEGLRRGVPLLEVATVSFFFSVGLVLPASLLWLKVQREVPALCEKLGLCGGRGLGVILREGLLWSVPAIAINLGYWSLSGRQLATSIQQLSSQPPMLGVLASSPAALVIVGCIAVPFVEELTYRGMLYRSLRRGHRILFSVLSSSVLFALDHPPTVIVPVFFAGVCMTLALERSRSLYAAIIVHMLYNGVAALGTLGLIL